MIWQCKSFSVLLMLTFFFIFLLFSCISIGRFYIRRAVHSNIISIVKPIRCTNVSNLFYFWNDTLHVSEVLSVHHQEFKTVHTYFSIVKPTRCTNVSNLFYFWNDTLHVSEDLSVNHQEFKTVHTATAVCLLASRQQLLYVQS